MTTGDRTTLSAVLGEDGNDEADNDVANIRERGTYFGRARLGLFAVLYLINKGNGKTTYSSHVMFYVINTLQLLYFCFNPKGAFSWSQEGLRYVIPVLKVVTFAFIKDLGNTATIAGLLTCYIIISLSLLAAIWVAYSFSSGGVKQLWILPILRVSMGLATTTFYVPILTVLFTSFDCQVLSSVSVSCNSTMYLVVVGVTCFIAILFISFTLVAVLVLYDKDPTGRNPVSLVHGRVQGVSLSCRAVMTFAFSFLDQSKPEVSSTLTKFVLAMVVLCSGVLMLGSTLYFLPYYCRVTNNLDSAFTAVFVWGGVCLLITQFLDDSTDSGVFYAFLLSLPVVFYSGYSLAAGRIRKLAATTRECDSVFTSELILRYKYPPDLENWVDVALPEYKALVTNKFKDSGFLNLHIAHLAKELSGNTILSSQFMRKARSLSLSLDQRFVLFKHSLEGSGGAGGRGGAISYIAIDHHFRQAEELIVEALEGIVRFWKTQTKSQCTAEKLFSYSDKVKRVSESARYHLDKLLELTNGSARAIRLYANFLKYVLNDKWKARELMEKADNMETNETEAVEDDFFDTRTNAIAILGGGEDNMGEILQVSDRFCKYFGYPRRQLVGCNISMLMPPPFSEVHTMWLTKHLEVTKSTVAISRRVWGLHKEGYVIAFELNFKSGLDENDNLIFTGKLSECRENGDIYVVATDEGNLMFASAKAWSKVLCRPADPPGSTETSLRRAVPELEEFDFTDVNGRPRPIEIQGTRFEVEITRLPYKNRQMDFLLIIFNQLDNFSDHGSQMDMFSDAEDLNEQTGNTRTYTDTDARSQGSESQSEFGSVAGGSTAGRQRNMYAKLEKKILEKSSQAAGFMRGCIICTTLFILLAIAENTIVAEAYNAYAGSVLQEYDAMIRATKVAQLTVAMQLYFLPRFNNSLTLAEAAELREYMEEAVEGLAHLHQKIEAESPIDYEPAQKFSHNQGVHTTVDGITFSDKSLFVAVQEFVNSIKHSLDTNERGQCGVECMYVLRSGPKSILYSCRDSALTYAEQTKYIKGLTALIDLVYAIAYLSLCAILTFRYLFSFAVNIWVTQESTALALLNIPKQAASDILKKTKAHLAELKQEDDELDGDGLGNQEPHRLQREASRASGRNLTIVTPDPASGNAKGPGSDTASKDKKVKIQEAESATPKQSSKKKRARKVVPAENAKKNKRKSRCVAFYEISKRTFQLAMPFLVPFGAFELAKFISETMIPSVVPAEVAYSGERAIAATWLWALVDYSGNYTKFNAFYPDDNFTQADFDLMKELYLEYRTSHDILVYGNYTHKVEGIMGGALFEAADVPRSNEYLLFRNACLTLCHKHPELQVSVDINFGLQSALEKSMQAFRGGFVDSFPGDGPIVKYDGPYIGTPPYQAFLSNRVLAEALQSSLTLYRELDSVHIDDSKRVHLLLVVFFIVLLLYGGTWTYGMYYRMTTQVQNTQFILFMVPVKVLLTMPELDKILKS